MDLNRSEVESDDLSKLQDQNGEKTKMQQKKLKTVEKEDRGNRRKYPKVKEIEKNKG